MKKREFEVQSFQNGGISSPLLIQATPRRQRSLQRRCSGRHYAPPTMHRHPSQNEDQLVNQLLQVEDSLERLALVQDRVRKTPPLPAQHRCESNRIHGCATKVWILAEHQDGVCRFQADSESSVVRGLASLIAEVFSGTTAAEAAEFESKIIERLGFERMITPTRLHGLAKLEETIRAFARSAKPAEAP
jgi:cysteine desulfuration protein SufE